MTGRARHTRYAPSTRCLWRPASPAYLRLAMPVPAPPSVSPPQWVRAPRWWRRYMRGWLPMRRIPPLRLCPPDNKAAGAALVRSDVLFLDDTGPERYLSFGDGPEFFGGAAFRLQRLRGELRADVIGLHDFPNFSIESPDDSRRGSGRSEQPHDVRHHEAGKAGFHHGRHARQQSDRLRARYRECVDPLAADHGQGRYDTRESNRDLSPGNRKHGGHAAFVRNVDQFHSGVALQKLPGH